MGSDQKRLISAVIISAIILFGWQYFFAPKPQQQAFSTTTNVDTTNTTVNSNNSVTPTDTNKEQAATVATTIRTISSFTIENYQLTVSNFLEIIDLKSNEATNSLLTLFGTDQPIRFNLEGGTPNFSFSQNGNIVNGIDSVSGVQVTISPGKNSRLVFEIKSPVAKKLSIEFKSQVDKLEHQKPRAFLAFETEIFRHAVDTDKRDEGMFKWYALEYKYDILALVNHEKPLASFVVLNNQASYNIAKEQTNYKFDVILAKKNYDKLIALGDNLNLAVDFGILGLLAVPILRCLQFFYNVIPNYGWSIILVTMLLRIVTFPLQYKSFKSMKKMQVIQPQLAKLKEKHKDNPQAMQKETMELFKKAGANPLGGCLPLLLQMPFFFAIWKVLSNAVELDGAPFHFWITNLTAKDPFYILPVLMGASMFMQQKLSPQTATDPVQQKVLMFMPLIFAFIMKDLPSGLVLYMIVSTTVGIIQQMIVYKTVD
jgi:YidC/Oxa1 family membrane protein insertase